MKRSHRRAFSLMEVLLATSILVGCLAVLSQLAAIGRGHADDAQRRTTAQAICQTKVNELLAGLELPDPVTDEELPDDPAWRYSLDTESLDQPGLLALRVTVRENVEDRRPRQFTLVRWIRDPDYHREGEENGPLRMRLPPGFRGGRRR